MFLNNKTIAEYEAECKQAYNLIMQRFVANEMYDAIGTVPKDYFKNNPEEFDRVLKVMLKNETKLGYISELNDDYWRAIIQSSQKPPVGEQYVAMMVYKENSSDINNLLSYLKSGKDIPHDLTIQKTKLENDIRNITDYINTTNLDKQIIVYRDDDGFKLNGIKFSDTKNLYDEFKNLSEELNNAKKHMNIVKVKQIQEEIKKVAAKVKSMNIEYTFTQERFMSTTFVGENRFDTKKLIRWEFIVPEKTKGTFIETYNDKTRNGKEIEYLLQRNTKVTVNTQDIEWSDEFNCLYIRAKIHQD